MGGFEVVDPRYRGLHERALAVLGDDPRVREVVVSGSIGAGTADAWSDLDLHVVAHRDAYDDLLADWPVWLAAITPTAFARTPVAPFVINTVTDGGLTFDLAVYADAEPAFATMSGYLVGQLARRPFATIDAALEYAVAEQVRGLAGPFVSLVLRGEYLRHFAAGTGHVLGLLTTVFLAELDAPPPGKHWNRTFTEEQRAAVAALPPLGATRDGVVGFGLALAELLVTRARPLFPRYELEWPRALAAVTAIRLRELLDVDTSAWLR
jgi:hypothetical protein